MSIVDKAFTVTKNVSLEIKLKDAEAKIASLNQERSDQISVLRQENSDLNFCLRQTEEKNASLEKKLIEIQSNPFCSIDSGKDAPYLSAIRI
jgi:predicted nuclease with TOPRIM domain